MRVLFLIPELRRDVVSRTRVWLNRRGLSPHFAEDSTLWTTEVFGGVLSIMRQCALARGLGVEAVLATRTGVDSYGDLGIGRLPFVAFAQRRGDDVCVIPDVYSRLADEVSGEVIVYIQGPTWIRKDFDHLRPNLSLWTCSPLLSAQCRQILPGKDPTFVPNIVDPEVFPFIEQESREPGRLAALPRKNAGDFIRATLRRYHEAGGRYWRLDLIDGVPFTEFAARYRTPQALLTASDNEGCGLPGMEAMAAGIAVVGKNGAGASFYMCDGETALVANTPESAAETLRAIEDPGLRQRMSQTAYDRIRRFFPDAEPKRFWEDWLAARRA